MARKHLLFLVLVIVLSSCASIYDGALPATFQDSYKGDFGDGGFLTGEPCGPPCFLGITPGITSKAETIKILKDVAYWDSCTSTDAIVCYNNLVISVDENDMVEGVGFEPTVEIALEQVVGKYGEPDDVVIFSNEHPNWVKISILYNDIHARLDLESQDGKIFTIKPSSKITLIAYMDNGSFDNFINKGQAQKWNGYQEYRFTAP